MDRARTLTPLLMLLSSAKGVSHGLLTFLSRKDKKP
jgi:hypothetical protein